MNRIFFLLLFIVITINGISQNSLNGRIIDLSNNKTISGANIYMPDLKTGSTSDINGNFIIKNLPKGKFLIEIKYLGYASRIEKIEINGNVKQDFYIEETSAELDEVVITGLSGSVEKSSNPVPTHTVGNTELFKMQSTNIIDAISKQPGISQITTGAAISKPVIRGLGYNRMISLHNNIRQEGQQWGDEHGIEIDENAIDRIEIIKGPGSLAFGSDAMAGVINFLAPRPIAEGKIEGSLSTNYQSNNGLMGLSFSNSGNIKGYSWQAQLSGKRAGNYSNKYDGNVYNSGYNELNAKVYTGINRKWGYAHLHFNVFEQNLGLIEGERDSSGNFIKSVQINDSIIEEQLFDNKQSYQLDVPKQNIGHYGISSCNNFVLGKSVLNITLGWQQNKRKEIAYIENDSKFAEGAGLHFLLNTYNADIKYFAPEWKAWETTLGFNGLIQNNKNKGVEFLIPGYNMYDAGIYLVSKKNFDRLFISGGLRYSYRLIKSDELILDENGKVVNQQNSNTEIKFKAFQNNYSSVSGSIGSSYKINKNLIVKLNLSSGYRSPNIAELASNGVHEGTFRYETGNQDLKSETSLQIDGGLEFSSKYVNLELSIFSNYIDNFIYSRKLNAMAGGDSIINAEGDNFAAFRFEQGNARLNGFEINLDFHPHPIDWLHFENSFSYVNGILLNQNDSLKYLPLMPQPRWVSEIRAQYKSLFHALYNPYLKIELEHHFSQNHYLKAYQTETATDSYTLLNLGIGSDFCNKKGNKILAVSINLNNLLDVAYQNHLSRLKYAPENLSSGRTGIYNMGRNLGIKIQIPIRFSKRAELKN